MKVLLDYLQELATGTLRGWNRFWFTPSDAATLGLIRILAGAMLLYTHLVWTKDFDAFFGPDAWLSPAAVRTFQTQAPAPGEPEKPVDDSQPGGPEMVPALPADGGATPAEPRAPLRTYAWSWFKWIDSDTGRWTVHLIALAAFACLMLGWRTRLASIIAWLATISYVNRVPGALFGLDQVNGMLAMYLAIGPSGSDFSVDRWLHSRRTGRALPPQPSVGANIAIRLIQLHMCVIYFFAGLGKLQGVSWWDGTAMWLAFANLEYQSLDMTWLARWPLLVNFMSHVTVYWEIFFCVLVWPRLTRPLMLLVAVPLHLGIAICLGMPTFGLAMLIGCASFISPTLVRTLFCRGELPAEPRGNKAPALASGA